ncbi:Gfo/Idh/MocA family protein [Intrasporangium sp.]|uniref:Gfo/Idh/MocA family protein n=1 Tax=Intrasporangium sp. TaxID=1925024 RepID=UPI00293AAE18|nr:Gfo/Idh/MocA family oxidoreductase [Intrasporangium sp.]MDV3221451.1 Gfo/Idh/MocA family oxidoreductase [Intrasporangium sp.]
MSDLSPVSAPLDGRRVVVRGSGSIGQRHARVLAMLGADVATWPVRPRAGASDSSGPAVHILDDASGPAALAAADLVVVATDTARHVRDTIEALDAGTGRILVEKPLAPTAAAAQPLASHPRARDVWVAAPLRAHAGFRHLLTLVDVVGRPASAHVRCQSWLPDWRPERDYRASYSARADEGGVLRDLVHELDYAEVLFGRPSTLAAHLDHAGPLDIEAEQAATLLWQTATATVTCRLDYITRPPTRGITIHGPEGSLEWDLPTATVTHLDATGRATTRSFPADLDRDTIMATQARAALEVTPGAAPAQRHTAGAPATLAEGLATLGLCDHARAIS